MSSLKSYLYKTAHCTNLKIIPLLDLNYNKLKLFFFPSDGLYEICSIYADGIIFFAFKSYKCHRCDDGIIIIF